MNDLVTIIIFIGVLVGFGLSYEIGKSKGFKKQTTDDVSTLR